MKAGRTSTKASYSVAKQVHSTLVKPMRALIVDDEPIARQVLREELELMESVEVVGEADNGASALSLLSSLTPDLVFLDVQMPVMNGFELLSQLRGGPLPAFVMVTAYDEHAIRAFEAGAVDYLLKPFGQQRLAQAVERASRLYRHPREAAESVAKLQELAPSGPASPAAPRKIVGQWGEEYFLLNLYEVLAFQAEGDVTWIVTAKQRYYAAHSLRVIEERLPNSMFRRIHRNTLININQIRKMSMITSQRWLVTLNNGDEFIVSKRQAKNVRDVLSW
jgi:two-component system, LytTR family, response regulator